MSMLRITEGEFAGRTIGEHSPPWQPKLVKLLFGHVDGHGHRMIREAFACIAKKSGKSTFASALALTKLLLHEEQREQIVLLAATKDQARICFDAMTAMIRADERLAERFEVVDFRSVIRYPSTNSRVTAIAAEMASLVGFNPSFAIVDELHLLGLTDKGRRLVAQIRTGNIARREPMLVSISTAPPDRSEGIFDTTLQKARRVISGDESDAHFFPWLCEVPPGLDAEDPVNWHWSNPSLGFTISLDRLIANFESAKSDPGALQAFRSQNLNIQPDSSTGAGRWLSLAQWDAVADPDLTFEQLLATSTAIWAGVDAGSLDDLSALVLLGQTENGLFLVWSHQWIARQGYDKRVSTNEYDAWIAAGELTLFEGGAGDIEGMAGLINTVAETGKLRGIGIDAHGARELESAFASTEVEVAQVQQGWRLTSRLTWLERRLADHALRHDGSPVMRWNVGNCVITRSGNARSVSKEFAISGKKIDGVAALLNSVAAHMEMEVEPRPLYETEGLLVLSV